MTALVDQRHVRIVPFISVKDFTRTCTITTVTIFSFGEKIKNKGMDSERLK